MLTLDYKNKFDGFGDIWSVLQDITKVAGSVTSTYLQVKSVEAETKKAKAAAKLAAEQRAAAAQAQQTAYLQDAATTYGANINKYLPYILIGGAGLVIVLLLKRKKEPAYPMPPMYYPPYMPTPERGRIEERKYE